MRDVDIELNNNPRCKAEIEHVLKGESWNMKNIPFIKVKGFNFEDGNKTMRLIFKEEILTEEEIEIRQNKFSKKIELEKPLDNPEEIEVKIGSDFQRKIPIELKKLFGKATYFDGTLISNPIVSVGGKMIAVGDERSNYEIFLSKEEEKIMVFDKGYSKERLECWLYDVKLKEDTKLDVNIGGLEVYELGAWLGYTSLYIHFVPMLITKMNAVVEREPSLKKGNLKDQDIFHYPEAWPHLNKEDVKVFIGGNEVPIKTFNEFDDFLGEKENEKFTRPGYIIGIAREDFKEDIIKIQIEKQIELEDEDVLEKGEGYYIGFVE